MDKQISRNGSSTVHEQLEPLSVVDKFKQTFWGGVFFLKSKLLIIVVLALLVIGYFLAQIDGRVFTLSESVVSNIGAEFIGGIIVVLAIAAFREKQVRKRGIDYLQAAERIKKIKRRFFMLGTYTFMFSDAKYIDGNVSAKQVRALREILDYKAKYRDEISIRFLLLDPNSPAAAQRDSDLEGIDVNVIERIENNLKNILEWQRAHPRAGIEVRIYNSLPGMSVMIWDDIVSFGFFEKNQSQSHCQRFESSTNGKMGRFIESAFDRIWESAVPIEAYMKTNPSYFG